MVNPTIASTLSCNMALPTNGRVVINTTAGEIDIELWSKVCNAFVEYMDWLLSIHTHWQETPKACRNFIALALEGQGLS